MHNEEGHRPEVPVEAQQLPRAPGSRARSERPDSAICRPSPRRDASSHGTGRRHAGRAHTSGSGTRRDGDAGVGLLNFGYLFPQVCEDLVGRDPPRTDGRCLMLQVNVRTTHIATSWVPSPGRYPVPHRAPTCTDLVVSGTTGRPACRRYEAVANNEGSNRAAEPFSAPRLRMRTAAGASQAGR
jgi:hypothetical protein